MSIIEQAMDGQQTEPNTAGHPDLNLAGSSENTERLEIEPALLAEQGMVRLSSKATRINEEFRNIKRKLLHNAFGPAREAHPNGNMIMVSSPNPSEGKTFTSINLALSMAFEKDKTVLLMDADVLKPSVTRYLGISRRAGLMEYLLGEVASVSEIIYPTSIPNLKLMPAGMPHDLSTELLGSEKMRALTAELASRYSDRVVVMDCPPLLGINETAVLSGLVGQALVVVQQDKTKLANVRQAVAQLDENLAIGFVVNKAVRGTLSKYGYGYGYGHGHGYGYGYGYGE